MSLVSLFQHRCILHRYVPGAVDEYGNANGTFTDIPDVPCFIQSGSRDRNTPNRTVTGTWTGYYLPNTVITEKDQVSWEGRRFLISSVVPEQSPRGTNQLVVGLKEGPHG